MGQLVFVLEMLLHCRQTFHFAYEAAEHEGLGASVCSQQPLAQHAFCGTASHPRVGSLTSPSHTTPERHSALASELLHISSK